jgi:hypothetical protein
MAPVTTYTATVHREGDWWVIDVDGVGATQAKRLDKVEHMARDLVATMRDVPIEDVQVDVKFDLAPDINSLLAAAKSSAEAAKAAQKLATELAQEAVTRLQGEHWSMRDIARVTGVSFQRVHQVLNEAVAAGRAGRAAVAARRNSSKSAVEVHASQGDAVAAARKRVAGAKRAAGKDRAGV